MRSYPGTIDAACSASPPSCCFRGTRRFRLDRRRDGDRSDLGRNEGWVSVGVDHDTADIAMSGFGSEDDVRQSFAAHLNKPDDVAALQETIGRVVCGCVAG